MHVIYPPVLFGLFAVLIPPLVYGYARRRPAVVGWGAMRFLRVPADTRRRLRLESGVLIGLRMAVIALTVFFLARPYLRGVWITRAEGRPPRDAVILIDNSEVMASRSDSTKARVDEVISRMWPGDRVAVFAVGGRVTPVLGRLTTDRELARGALELLPRPGGTADWPSAFNATPAAEVVAITAGTNPALAEFTMDHGSSQVWVLDVTDRHPTADELDERRGRGPATRELRWAALAAAMALLIAERRLARRSYCPTPGYRPAPRPIGSGRSA
jgi:hypothetical protein